VLSYDDHPDFVYSVEWNGDGSQLATACKDKLVRVFDPRKKGSAIKGAGFDGPKGSRLVWIPSFNKIVNVGFNKSSTRQFMVHDMKKFDAPILTTDIDANPGVLLPWFDPDNMILYLAGKGDASIRYWEVVNEEPFLHFLSEFRDTESVKGCNFVPKRAVDTKTCEIAVAFRIMKDLVSPVSFCVPRKSDLFQTDIYPDTYAGVPSVTAAEWLAGTDKPVIKRGMKPGSAAAQGGVAAGLKVEEKKEDQRTVADVEKEITAAKAKVATLEAELAQLKIAASGSGSAAAAGSS